MDVLEGIFICGAPGCLRSFLARPEFDWHVVEFHSQFLQPESQKNSSIKGSCFSNSLEVQVIAPLICDVYQVSDYPVAI